MEIASSGLVGYSGEAFIDYMKKLNQATNGSQSLPTGYEPETVKGIISNKENQDLYDQMKSQAKLTSEKTSKMNGTENLDIYNDSGITTINKFANLGKNIDISV